MSFSTPPSSPPSTASTSSIKRVIFIRHAQSDENVKFGSLMEGIARIQNFQLPQSHSFTNGVKLLRMELDSNLSPLGIQQVESMRQILIASNFYETFNPEAVYHSPLKRARDTLLGVLPQSSNLAAVTPDLREATPSEHIFPSTLITRINSFTIQIASSPYTRIVVCGHSQYFKRLLGMREMMRNVDVWAADLTVDEGGMRWGGISLLHRSPLAPPHPMDNTLTHTPSTPTPDTSIPHTSTPHTPTSPTSTSTSSPHTSIDPPTCRFCQCSSIDDPSPMLMPCNCTGTQAFVHLNCLNLWRSTSTTASSTCSVCGYQYNVSRSWAANFLLAESGTATITFILIFLTIFATGILFHSLANRYSKVDIAVVILKQARIAPWWRSCKQRRWSELIKISQRLANDEGFVSGKKIWFIRALRGYMYVFGSPLLLDATLCTGIVQVGIDIFIIGVAVVGAVGCGTYIIEEIQRAARRERDFLQVFVFIMSMASWSNAAMGRLGMVIGVGMSYKVVYRVMAVKGRTLAQTIGEVILEPGRGRGRGRGRG